MPHREFHRPARVYPAPVDGGELRIASPPAALPPAGNAMIQLLLPVLGSTGMIGFAVILGERRYLIMAVVFAGAMLLSGIISRIVQTRSSKRARADRIVRYRRHLDETRIRLVDAARAQRRHDEIASPPSDALWSVVADGRRVWERRTEHADFLAVRVATGPSAPALVPVCDRGADPMTELEPDLVAAADHLAAGFGSVADTAVTIDLGAHGCVAVVGQPDVARSLVRSILSQLVVLRAPDDVRVVAAHAPDAGLDWSWLTHAPHCAVEGAPLVTSDPDDLADILEQITRPRIDHLRRDDPSRSVRFSRVVVVIDDYAPDTATGRLEILDEILADAHRLGITVVCVSSSAVAIPTGAGITLTLRGPDLTVTAADPSAVRRRGRAEQVTVAQAVSVTRALSPLRLRSRSGRTTTIESVGLFELLGMTDPEDLEPDLAWLDLDDEHLRVPIGVAEDGSHVVLDLKESSAGGMGPHGMLIGATGSGKSELLRTLVLGLAARHHPEDLAFVLVDFKGGATFTKIDRLPHSAGLITNLERDPALVDRMLEALYGELERRQRALHEAGGFDRADEYRTHRRTHPELDLEPLPALLVVVDEFGELLGAQPQFSELFSTIGRVGRSLGVHLLLSTQRIDEGRIRKLEGHLRYRLCLRTFTPEESMTVIGSKAAAELPPIPGVGYLKVDGTMTAFKSGYVVRPMRGTDHTEMGFLLDRLGGEATAGRRVTPVWLEPLPETFDLEPLVAGTAEPGSPGWLRAPVGLEDDPSRQRTGVFSFDLSGATGNLAVVGAPRTGKSTLLQTLAVSLAAGHRPFDLQIYGVDLGGGGLHLLADLPHMGAILGRSNRIETVKLIRLLAGLIEERAETFRRHRLTSMAGYHDRRRNGEIDDDLGEVILMVDNWAAFTQELTPELIDDLAEIVTSGLHHGVHVVLAAARWQDIRPALRDNIGGRFELRLNDPVDSEIDRTLAAGIPAGTPGRGIGPAHRMTQIALPHLGGTVDQTVAHLAAGSDGPSAPPIRTLPESLDRHDLPTARMGGQVLGLEEHRLGPWEVDLLGAAPHLLVLGDAESGKTNLLRSIVRSLCEQHSPDEVQIAAVDYRRTLAAEIPSSHRFGTAGTAETALSLAQRIDTELRARRQTESVNGHDGPAIVLLVDDYDLVAGPTGNPLSTLVEHVARGRDLGLHVVLARRVGGVTRSSFEPLFQQIRELGTPGVILSGDPAEGALIGNVKAAVRGPGRGLWVSKGRVTEVQAALAGHGGAGVHELERRTG